MVCMEQVGRYTSWQGGGGPPQVRRSSSWPWGAGSGVVGGLRTGVGHRSSARLTSCGDCVRSETVTLCMLTVDKLQSD